MGKRTFKQNLSLLLVPFQLFSLTACGPKDDSKKEDISETSYHQTEEIIRVEYKIKGGDTLVDISSRYKVSVDEIERLNNINGGIIYAGDKIFMDVSRTIFNRYCDELIRVDINNEIDNSDNISMNTYVDGNVIEYEIVSGDTLSGVANRFGISISQIQGYKDESKIYVGDKLILTGVSDDVYERYKRELQFGNVIEYEIKSGDTLSEIANRFGVSVEQIQGYKDESKIYVGDKLMITGVSDDIYEKYINRGNTISLVNESLDSSRVESGNVIEYEIKSGDSLSGIAERFGVSIEQIQGYRDKSKIYAGDKLMITGVSDDIYEKYINSGNTISLVNDSLNSQRLESSNVNEGEYLRGIDISKHQGNIDWDVMQRNYENGVFNYIIIRIADNVIPGTSIKEFTVDSKFEEYLSECNKRGIPYSVYMFSRKTTVTGIREEANSMLEYINNNLNTMKELDDGRKLDLTFKPALPLYFDCFEGNAGAQRKILDTRDYDLCVELIVEWCKIIEDAGYYPGVYYHLDAERQLGNLLDNVLIGEYNIPINRWVAYYGPRNFANMERKIEEIGFPDVHVSEMKGNVYSYQVEEQGIMPGIGNVRFDVNIASEELINLVREYYQAKGINYYDENISYISSRGK